MQEVKAFKNFSACLDFTAKLFSFIIGEGEEETVIAKVRSAGQSRPMLLFNKAPQVIWLNLSVVAPSESPSAAQDPWDLWISQRRGAARPQLAVSRSLGHHGIWCFSLRCVFTTHSHKGRQLFFAATEENLHSPSLFRTGDNRQ